MLACTKQWLFMVTISLVIACVALPAASWADVASTVPTASKCKETVGPTHRAAVCLRAAIDAGSEIYFNKFGGFLTKTITAAMTLAVILYGILLSFGMVEKVGRDTFLLLLKMAFVIYLVANPKLIFTTVTKMMDGAALAITSFVPPSGPADHTSDSNSDFSKSHCLQNVATQKEAAGNPMPAASPWLGMDCMLDTVIGIKVPLGPSDPTPAFQGVFQNSQLDPAGSAKAERGLSRGLLNFFFSSMQSSIVGLVLAIVGLVFVFGTVMLIIRAFFMYIMGYMGIAFLAIVSPLFMPMLLFSTTRQYFDKWVKLLISFALQPVFMLVFVIFTIAALDLAVFTGSYSIMYSIAGDASREKGFNINEYLAAKRNTAGDASNCASCVAISEKKIRVVAQVKAENPEEYAADKNVRADEGGVSDGLKYSKCTKDFIEKDTTGALKKFCSFAYPLHTWTDNIAWDRVAKARRTGGSTTAPTVAPAGYPDVLDDKGVNSPDLQAGQYVLRMVLASCFLTVMTVFVMSGLLGIVSKVSSDILGDAGQTPDFSKVASGGGAQASNAGNRISDQIGSMAGKR